MIEADIHGVEFLAVNTDAQQLAMSDAARQDPASAASSRGPRLGLRPRGRPPGRRGRRSTASARCCEGSDLVFVAAGEGGGTGTGAAPVVARIARELGALTVGIVTMPFGFEGTRRAAQPPTTGLEAPAAQRRHAHRRPQRPPAGGARREHLDGRRVPRRRRRPAPGRAGHLRPDHAARPDQPRLRRRAHGHGAIAASALMGIGMATRPEPRPRGCAPRGRLAADRPRDPGRDRHPALDRRRRRPRPARGHRGRRGRPRGRQRRRATSSSAPRSTRRSAGQIWVTVIATGFERAAIASAGRRERRAIAPTVRPTEPRQLDDRRRARHPVRSCA